MVDFFLKILFLFNSAFAFVDFLLAGCGVFQTKRMMILQRPDWRFSGLSGGSPNEYECELFSYHLSSQSVI